LKPSLNILYIYKEKNQILLKKKKKFVIITVEKQHCKTVIINMSLENIVFILNIFFPGRQPNFLLNINFSILIC